MTKHQTTPDHDADDAAAAHLRGAARHSDDSATRELRERLAPLLSGYELGPRLGRGGMGVVFRARQTHLGRDVAIKVLVPPPGDALDWSERFQREAKALAKLSHPGIVTIHDFGQAEGLAWIIMEAVEGTSLRDLLNGEALSPEEALAIVPGICAALQYAHDQGVVHRDVKPENVLVDMGGNVKLVDFGLAKLAATDGDVLPTRSDQAMGTLRYMAPEQLDEPRSVDHRADIFSLGVVLYEMLTGKVPQGVFEPPSKRVEVDVRIDEVVMRSLEREPERRYQHVSEVKDRVERIRSTPVEGSRQAVETDVLAGDSAKRARAFGASLDGIVLLLFLGLFGSAGQIAAVLIGIVGWFTGLSAALLITISAPLIIGAFVTPGRSLTLMPIVRLASGATSMAVVLYCLMLLVRVPPESVGAGVEDGAIYISVFRLGIVMIVLAPFVTAALTSIGPTRWAWRPPMQELFRWIGGALSITCACLGVFPWTKTYSIAQIMFGIGFLALGVHTMWINGDQSPARLASTRARAFAIAGVIGVALSRSALWTGGAISMDNYAYASNAMLACIGLTVLGGIAGVGSPRRGTLPRGR